MRHLKFGVCLLLTLITCYFAKAQTITIVQPNGGEVLYVCQAYPITWTQTGTVSNYWNIDYSLDGGTIWASVATNFLSTTGQFNWTVPNIQSNTVLMRVYDAQNTVITDQSNAYFSINIPVTVTAPNGGETWQGGTVQNITWNAGGTSNRYSIAYSVNNGSTWTNIVTNLSTTTGSYAWTVPVIPLSSTCLIRVQDFLQSCMQDVSNSVFTITPPVPILTAPNGGQTFQVGCAVSITWDISTLYTSARLDYSVNNGTTWVNIITSTTNDGAYSWPAPNLPSTTCLIRVSNVGAISNNDVSNAPFTIATPLAITYPNGGETLIGCNNINIAWTKTTCAGAWQVYYTTDGTAYSFIAGIPDNGLNTQTYSWQVPNGINVSTARFSITSGDIPAITDSSNTGVNIIPSNDITITSPNGGESWQGYSTHTISWTNLPSASGQYTLQYSTNNGSTWTNIATNITGNTYNWSVPHIPSSTCLIKIIDYINPCKYDVSNTVFAITPVQPLLLTPNGGQTFQVGCAVSITWDISTLYTSARLDYSVNNGTTWVNIITSTTNDGAYSWPAPNLPSTTCLIRVSNVGAVSNNDVSNAPFTIATPLAITYPNGGETLIGCNNINIAWTKTTCAGAWQVYYTTDGTAYSFIAGIPDNGLNTQTYSWQVPNGINVSTARFSITSGDVPAITDTSNTAVNIIPSNDITITSPNGGESWQGYSTHAITWTNLPSASGQYTLQYSTNNGSTWTSIATNITGNTYNWSVPHIPSSTCLIKIIDYINPCKYDVSNAVFAITPVQPLLLTPNGGQTFQVGCAVSITWDISTLYTSARLDYSVNNGTTWVNIITSTTNDGAYSWPAPNLPSTTCLIRVSNVGAVSNNDVSNATFTIATPLAITYPNGGETLIGCNNINIAWTKTTCAGAWQVYYTTDGTAYSFIAGIPDNGLNTQTYSWQVPNGINVSTARFSITSGDIPAITDSSNTAVNIIPSNDITITSPNGGESWQGYSTHSISWTNLPSASGQYTLQYSTNNGSTWTNIATNITGNTYNWSVPHIPSSTCLIKIIDYINPCKYDVSNAVFAITPVQPLLLTPNGGQTFQVGCAVSITWDISTLYTSARLDYSVNNGTTWVNIITSTTNDGAYSWPAPNLPSTTCLIRISNVGAVSNNDVSNAPFTIATPLAITYPNGGETLIGCNNINIAWTKTTCAGAWQVYYTTDGTAYSFIAGIPDNGLNTQTYSWQVPNGINVSTARFSITSGDVPAITDTSNTAVNIIPSNDITITSPNGGESWQGYSTHAITWTNLPSASGQYTLQYSTNSGSTWTNIATNITGNTYNWSVPHIPSSTCLIKIIDYINPCKYDVSNAVFAITPVQPLLLTPNGGQIFQVGCAVSITWDISTLYTSARLDYSVNNGTTWVNIITSTTNDGAYSWPAPNLPSTTCLIRVSNAGAISNNDVSNAPFTIATPLAIMYPNGGETLIGCNNINIAWTKTTCAGAWQVYYTTDGTAYSFIAGIPDNGLNTQTYSWQVPNGINVSTARFSITSGDVPAITDTSNTGVNIIPSNDITITSPNGGESWQGFSTHAISWTNLPSASGQYTLQYSTNNGSTWTNIATNITGNSYNWLVPHSPASNCLIKVIDYINPCKYDVSNTVFAITPIQPVLLTPNGGEVFYAGVSTNITWDPVTMYASARLDYSLDNGVTWTNIISSTTNDGIYSWVVPNANTATALVRISNVGNISLTDVSDAVFTIKPAVTILTPNGNNQVSVGGCTATSITFDHSPAWTSYQIEYTLNDGTNWTTITSAFTASVNPATYNWNVPNIFSAQARVRVTPVATTYSDISDDVFSIIKTVTIIQPNFGGIMQAGTTYDIMWSSDGISSVYDLSYSTNGGTSFTSIVTGYNTSTNKYTWTVPNIPSTNCRILIRDNVNTCKSDTSDVAFIISSTAPPITLIKPNGNSDTLHTCSTYTITWSDVPTIGTYNIAYSLNSGISWTNIVTNYSTATHSYDWAIPTNIPSGPALLRVSSASNATIFDLSDALFTIMSPTYIFTGNGNWSQASNWLNNQVPPLVLPTCSEIIIDPLAAGECVLDVAQTMPSGTKLTVRTGKKFRIPGNLIQQ